MEKEEKHNFIENNLLILSKQTMDVFLKEKNPADLIALYVFYYYTAKWQKTNQPKCTTNYTAKGLNWSEDRVRKTKKVLIKLGLIQDEKYRVNGRVAGWYIKINYLWKTENEPHHPNDFPECGKDHSVEEKEINALSDNNINALSDNRLNAFSDSHESQEKQPSGKEINEIIDWFKAVSPLTYKDFFANKTERKYAGKLLEKMDKNNLEILITKALPILNTTLYIPQNCKAFKPSELYRNFDRVLSKIKELKDKRSGGKYKVAIIK